MKKEAKHKIIINNVIKETQLLESLEWDEDILKELYDYLDVHFSGDSIITPALLLKEIDAKFGKDCTKVLRSMFLEISLTHGLFTHDPNIEN
jgi:hypothetical protein